MGDQCLQKCSKTKRASDEPKRLEKGRTAPKKDDRSYEERREYLRDYQKGWVRSRRLIWLEANGPCRQCGSWERLEIDHVDPTRKTSHRIWSWSAERRAAELKKCQVLCHACHRAKTKAYNRRHKTGKKGVTSKLDPKTVEQIYRKAKAGGRPRALSREYGVCHSTIVSIRDGHTWRWLTSKLDQKAPEQLSLISQGAA